MQLPSFNPTSPLKNIITTFKKMYTKFQNTKLACFIILASQIRLQEIEKYKDAVASSSMLFIRSFTNIFKLSKNSGRRYNTTTTLSFLMRGVAIK